MKGLNKKYCTFSVHINWRLISEWPGLEHNKINLSIDGLYQMTAINLNKTLHKIIHKKSVGAEIMIESSLRFYNNPSFLQVRVWKVHVQTKSLHTCRCLAWNKQKRWHLQQKHLSKLSLGTELVTNWSTFAAKFVRLADCWRRSFIKKTMMSYIEFLSTMAVFAEVNVWYWRYATPF